MKHPSFLGVVHEKIDLSHASRTTVCMQATASTSQIFQNRFVVFFFDKFSSNAHPVETSRSSSVRRLRWRRLKGGQTKRRAETILDSRCNICSELNSPKMLVFKSKLHKQYRGKYLRSCAIFAFQRCAQLKTQLPLRTNKSK